MENQSEILLMEQARSGNLEFAVRKHHAVRAGLHFDLVIGSSSADWIADFVIPKPKQLEELGTWGRGHLAIALEPHSKEIFLDDDLGIEHVIEDEYGKGTWETVLKGIARQTDHVYTFILESGANKYKFIRMKPKHWLIRRTGEYKLKRTRNNIQKKVVK